MLVYINQLYKSVGFIKPQVDPTYCQSPSSPATMAYRVQGVYCHEHRNPAGYPLLSSKYQYNIHDIFVEAKLTETYQASTNTEREVSYIFEIPPESSVVEFTAQVGDNQVKASK